MKLESCVILEKIYPVESMDNHAEGFYWIFLLRLHVKAGCIQRLSFERKFLAKHPKGWCAKNGLQMCGWITYMHKFVIPQALWSLLFILYPRRKVL